jgi:hypothetical protein
VPGGRQRQSGYWLAAAVVRRYAPARGIENVGNARNTAAAALVALSTIFSFGAPAAVAHAGPASQSALAKGTIVALKGTPHLWIADPDGVLHWSGDTRALAGREVDWSNRREVSLDELKQLRRGDPWLSAGLMKDGDPIFFVKWENDQPAPQLLHIQSIADVDLFGINAANYGQYVIDRQAWETRFGIQVGGLRRGVLSSATSSAGATAAANAAAAAVSRGALAGTLTAEAQRTFLESALGRRGVVAKWNEPIRVQLRRSTYDSQSGVVDSIVNELSSVLGSSVPISRVGVNGNIVIDFRALAELKVVDDETLGWAETETDPATGALRSCSIVVAHDPESILGSLVRHISPQMKTDLQSLVLRHEIGHCLGLGHNSDPASFMSYLHDPWGAYYTKGSRASSFSEVDRALIRTQYHPAVRPGMKAADLDQLFTR